MQHYILAHKKSCFRTALLVRNNKASTLLNYTYSFINVVKYLDFPEYNILQDKDAIAQKIMSGARLKI